MRKFICSSFLFFILCSIVFSQVEGIETVDLLSGGGDLIDESRYFNEFILNSNSEYFDIINSLKYELDVLADKRNVFHENIMSFDNPVKVTPVSLEKKTKNGNILPGDYGMEYLNQLISFFYDIDKAKDRFKEYYINVKKQAALIEQNFLIKNQNDNNINTLNKLYDYIQVLPAEAFGLKKDLYELGIYFKDFDSEIFQTYLAVLYTMSVPYIMERSADLIDNILIKNPEDSILEEEIYANRIFYTSRIENLFFDSLAVSEALWFLSQMSITQPYLDYSADKGLKVDELKLMASESIQNIIKVFNSLSEFQLSCIFSSDYQTAFGIKLLYNTIYCLKILENDFDAVFPFIEKQVGSSLASLDYFFNSAKKNDNYTFGIKDCNFLSVEFLSGYKDALELQEKLNSGSNIYLCDFITTPELFYIIDNSGLFNDLKLYYYSNKDNLFLKDSVDYKFVYLNRLSEKFTLFKNLTSKYGISPFYFITNEQFSILEFLEVENYNPGYFGLYDIERLSYLIKQLDDALIILNSAGKRMSDIIYERSFFK